MECKMSESHFDYSVSQKGEVYIIVIHDPRLDSTKAPRFKTELLRVIAGGAKKVLINLRDVETIDSSGLGILTFGRRQMDDNGGTLSVCCLQDKVLRLFNIAKLDRVFSVFDTEEEGVKNL